MTTITTVQQAAIRDAVEDTLRQTGQWDATDGTPAEIAIHLAGTIRQILTTDVEKYAPARPVGDQVDGLVSFGPLAAEMERIETTLVQLERGIKRGITRTGPWQDLAKWIAGREKRGEPLERWITWYMADPFNAKTAWRLKPEAVKNSWPQAFPQASQTEKYDYAALRQIAIAEGL